jgi:hypothetical protein
MAGTSWCGKEGWTWWGRLGLARSGAVWYGRYGEAGSGKVRFSKAGMAWSGEVGAVRYDTAGKLNNRS